MKTYIQNTLSLLFAFIFLLVNAGLPLVVEAASVSSFKDTMSTQAPSATATHTLTWTLVGGDTVATAETYAIDFSNTDFTLNSIGNWQTSDFAFSDGTRSNQAPVAVGAAPSCSAGSNNYTVTIDTTNNTFTITTCASWNASGANANITFVINGTTASGTGTMTNGSDVDSSQVSLTQSNGDTGLAAVSIETNSVVSITATVNPTLTFANDDASIGFGTLSAAAARYANSAASGSGTDTTAHTMTVGTNATGGYVLTYNGPTLTSGLNTIDAATITGDANGTPGSEQFALAAALTGGGTVASGYNNGANDWNFVPTTTTTLASASAPTSDSIAMHYLANIASTTPAGSYATSITYVATGTF